MLPLRRLSDSYRAGIWVIRKNLNAVLAIGTTIVALNLLDGLIFDSLASSGLTVMFVIFAPLVLTALYGGLLTCFHATFLAEPDQTANALIDTRRFFRVTFRFLAITLLELLLLFVGMSVVYGAMGFDAVFSFPGILTIGLAVIVGGIFATIVLGLRIPHLVKHPDRSGLPPSATLVTSMRMMFLPLICGPAFVLGLTYLPAFFADPNDLEMHLVDYVYLCIQTMVEILAAAMTAAILSDTYLKLEAVG